MNADELNDAWNALRNRALGRGTKPRVSKPLARKLSSALAAWREFRASPSRTLDRISVADLNEWVSRYNALDRQVAAELHIDAQPKEAATSVFRDVTTAAADAATPLLVPVAVVGVAAGLLHLFISRRR